MSGSLVNHIKRDEELLVSTVQSLLVNSGVLLVWIVLLMGLALSIVLLEP